MSHSWHQVVERAQQKLKLDAMIVQQGRLTENAKKVNYNLHAVFDPGGVGKDIVPVSEDGKVKTWSRRRTRA